MRSVGIAQTPAEAVYSFYREIDRGVATKSISYVTDEIHAVIRGEVISGREAMARFLERREEEKDRQSLHVVSNAITNHLDNDSVAITSLLLVYMRGGEDQLALMGVYDAEHIVVRDGAGWKIRQRQTVRLHREL